MVAARRSVPAISSHPFVGRGELLEALRGFLADVRAGKGGTILLTGQTGVGKSTLVSTVTEEARKERMMVLEGRSLPREIPQPFEAIKEAFRGLSTNQIAHADGREGGLRALWTPERQTPSSLVPLGLMAWRDMSGGSNAPTREGSEGTDVMWESIDRASGGVEEDRLALFDRLFQTISRVAQHQPVLLALEDVHLADATTMEFLRYIARLVPTTPLGVLLTSLPLEELLHGSKEPMEKLTRDGTVEIRKVRPLNVDEVREHLRSLNAGKAPDEETVTRLFAESEGNPLFLERLALGERGLMVGSEAGPEDASTAPGGAPRPGGGSSTSRGRGVDPLDSAGEVGRKLLAYGAVLGEEFSFATLRQVAEGEEEAVARALELLVRSGVLRELPGEVYTFQDPALKDALLASLTETRRRRLHRRLAEVMEVLGPDAQGEEVWVRKLAHHFHEGRQDMRSFEYNCRLFDLARHAGRVGEARESLERALESLRHLPPESKERREQEREVLLQLGEVLAEAGELRRSEERLMDAFVMFLPNEPHQAAQLALARTHLHQGKYSEARRRVEGLVPADGEGSPSPNSVEAAGLLAEAALALGNLEEALTWSRRALHYAESLPDLRLLGDSCRRLGDYYLHLREETDRARALYQRAFRLFDESGDELRRVRLELPLAEVDFLRGRIEDGYRRLESVASWGEVHGAKLLRAEALLRTSHHALASDTVDRSVRSLLLARELVPAEGGPRFELHYAILEGRHAHRKGEHEKGHAHLARAEVLARASPAPTDLYEVLLARAEGELAKGDKEKAQSLLEEARGLGVGRADQLHRWWALHRAVTGQPPEKEPGPTPSSEPAPDGDPSR